MKTRNAIVLLVAIAFASAPIFISNANARAKDKPNFGYCKSGAKVGNIKNCKENGGKK